MRKSWRIWAKESSLLSRRARISMLAAFAFFFFHFQPSSKKSSVGQSAAKALQIFKSALSMKKVKVFRYFYYTTISYFTFWGILCTLSAWWGPSVASRSGSIAVRSPKACSRWRRWWWRCVDNCTRWRVRRALLRLTVSRGICPRATPRHVPLRKKTMQNDIKHTGMEMDEMSFCLW